MRLDVVWNSNEFGLPLVLQTWIINLDVVWNSVYFILLSNPPISVPKLINTAPLWLNEGTPGGAVFTGRQHPSGATVWWTLPWYVLKNQLLISENEGHVFSNPLYHHRSKMNEKMRE